jgi:1-deoxy-D-xylulose-5-phosphate reductoisomerase
MLNAANEVAVSSFLQGRIGFLSIPALVEDTLAALPVAAADSLQVLLAADAQARRHAERAITQGVPAMAKLR